MTPRAATADSTSAAATWGSTGHSDLADPTASITAAMDEALAGLGGRRGQVGLVFASGPNALGPAMATASARSPGTAFVGCGTAGEFSGRGLTRGGAVVMLLASDELGAHSTFARRLGQNPPERSAARLAEGFSAAAAEAASRRLAQSTTILLTDGLCTSQEQVVTELRRLTRPFQQVIGGAAGDDLRMVQTFVAGHREVAIDAAVALHLFTRLPVGVGVEHGLVPASPRMVATRAAGNVVQEIDGRRPLDVYAEHARTLGVALDDRNRGTFMMHHELGVFFFDDLVKARAPLAVTPEGWLVCGGAVPKNAGLCIVAGEPTRMVEAARRAAEAALEGIDGRPAAAVLVFDCVCRGSILGDRFGEEINAVQSVFPGAPVAGFLSYGEIARFKGKMDGYHNNTVVVAAIPS